MIDRHPDWERLEALMPAVREFQALAQEHGIDDIFQDNGGKILQMLLALNLQGIPGREGNDAVDTEGREFELKSVNIWLTASFSTNHHINVPIINKYRKVCWVFAVYEGIEMRRAYFMPPGSLEEYFQKWEDKWTAEQKVSLPLNFRTVPHWLIGRCIRAGRGSQVRDADGRCCSGGTSWAAG